MNAPLFAARLKLCREKRRAATWGLPYGGFGSGPFFFVGAGHWPARREGSAIPKPTLIRLACARHLPPCRGKACGRPKVAPSKYGKLSGRSVGADDLGGPRAHTVRPYREKKCPEMFSERGNPPPLRAPPLTRGALAGGHIRDTKSRLSREHPHPSGLRPAIFPLGGGRLAGGPVCRPYGMAWAARPGGRALRASWSTEDGRPHGAAPTAEIGPGALVRQCQAQK